MSLTDDFSPEAAQRLIGKGKEYASLQREYWSLDLSERMGHLIGMLALALVVALMAMLALLTLTMACAYLLSQYIGLWQAFAIMTGVMVALLAIVYAGRRTWLYRPIQGAVRSVMAEGSTAAGAAPRRKQDVRRDLDLIEEHIELLSQQLLTPMRGAGPAERFGRMVDRSLSLADGVRIVRRLWQEVGRLRRRDDPPADE